MKRHIELQLDLTVFFEIYDSDPKFSMFGFVLLEALRQNNEDAFKLFEQHPHFKGDLLQHTIFTLQDSGYLKVLNADVDDSWWSLIDLRQLYINRFPQKAASDVEIWIDEWRNKFPAGVRSGGYPVKGDRIGCLSKMKTFISRYKYSKEVIFAATDRYIETKRKERWQFMQLAHYFILKDNQSTLSMFCEEIINRVDPQQNSESHDYTITL